MKSRLTAIRFTNQSLTNRAGSIQLSEDAREQFQPSLITSPPPKLDRWIEEGWECGASLKDDLQFSFSPIGPPIAGLFGVRHAIIRRRQAPARVHGRRGLLGCGLNQALYAARVARCGPQCGVVDSIFAEFRSRRWK